MGYYQFLKHQRKRGEEGKKRTLRKSITAGGGVNLVSPSCPRGWGIESDLGHDSRRDLRKGGAELIGMVLQYVVERKYREGE